jgi:hypothetical protein
VILDDPEKGSHKQSSKVILDDTEKGSHRSSKGILDDPEKGSPKAYSKGIVDDTEKGRNPLHGPEISYLILLQRCHVHSGGQEHSKSGHFLP